MRLLIDAGNSRLKWQLQGEGGLMGQGRGSTESVDPLPGLPVEDASIARVAVSTVASEGSRRKLLQYLSGRFGVPVRFYWAEAFRNGLTNAYQDYRQMGADRWHAMCGAWSCHKQGFAIVDAGSAITVDYVRAGGEHLGGFILPGLRMMRRSLQVDAARIDFAPLQNSDLSPGASTTECVNHGLAWLTSALVDRVHQDVRDFSLEDILATGGDGGRLLELGLAAKLSPSLVLDGLAIVDAEASSK